MSLRTLFFQTNPLPPSATPLCPALLYSVVDPDGSWPLATEFQFFSKDTFSLVGNSCCSRTVSHVNYWQYFTLLAMSTPVPYPGNFRNEKAALEGASPSDTPEREALSNDMK
jgi:hypothetical protein